MYLLAKYWSIFHLPPYSMEAQEGACQMSFSCLKKNDSSLELRSPVNRSHSHRGQSSVSSVVFWLSFLLIMSAGHHGNVQYTELAWIELNRSNLRMNLHRENYRVIGSASASVMSRHRAYQDLILKLLHAISMVLSMEHQTAIPRPIRRLSN